MCIRDSGIAPRHPREIVVRGERRECNPVLLRSQAHARAHQIEFRVDVALVLAGAIGLGPGLFRGVDALGYEPHHRSSVFRAQTVSKMCIRDSPERAEFASALYELRKAKGMTEEQALELMDNVLYFGNMTVSYTHLVN